MKVFIFLVLLAVTTSLDAAVVQELGGIEGDKLRKVTEAEPAIAKKAGQTVESLRKLLEGDFSLSTVEERESVLDTIKALSITGEPEEGTEEYFIALIVKAIVVGIVTGAAGAGVRHLVERNEAKRNG